MKEYVFLLLIIFFIGCTNQQEKKIRYSKEQVTALQLDSTEVLIPEIDSAIGIDLNPFLKEKTFDFGSLVKELKFISLETTDKGLLDRVRKVIVTASYVYVHDDFKGGGIVVFDKTGKFITRIPNGKGPGELVRLYDIAFDKYNDELIVYQHSFLLHFTPAGKFIRQERLPFGFYNFTVIPDGYVFKTVSDQGNFHLGTFQHYTLLITNKKFKINSVGLNGSPQEINYGVPTFLCNNKSLDITDKFRDTIYQYISEDNLLKAKYVLDYSKKKLPESYTRGSWEKFENTVRENDYFFYIGQYNSTDSHNVFFLSNWHKKLQTVVYRDKNSGILIGGTNANYNIDKIPPIAFPRWVSDDYFVSIYYPNGKEPFITNSSIISDKDKQKIKVLTENDNPVLVFFKLKDFK